MNSKENLYFDINERFEFVEKLTKMVCFGHANSVIITGQGGLGKTHTVLKAIEDTKIPYKKISGHSTARGLYNLLYDYNGSTFLFDDCDSVLDDKTSQNILKIALDSNEDRTITWAAKMPKGSEYPNEFEFTGRIIFITNKPQNKIFQPLLTRGYKVDLSMDILEKIERMKFILPTVCETNNINLNIGFQALAFLEEKQNIVKSLSLRTLLDVIRIINSGQDKWERLAEYTITQ
ncbi:MAG: hypothetical protein ACOCP8_09575 [archaeon]